MAKLQNDIGHGINTYPPSKGVPGMAEFEFNTVVGQETKRLLQGLVDTVEAQPFNGKDVPLINRTNYYNAEFEKDKFSIGISNHANANDDPNQRGFGVFYWHNSEKSKKLAQLILEEYKKEFPSRIDYPIWGTGLFPSNPGTWSDFHMTRETKAPFVLVEWEFMTNAAALKLLKSDDYRKRCAKVNAKAVCRWYGIEFKEKAVLGVATKSDKKVIELTDGQKDDRAKLAEYGIMDANYQFTEQYEIFNANLQAQTIRAFEKRGILKK